MNNLPKARTTDILEQVAGDELMIYDQRIDKAYNLNETSKIVYLACNGKMSYDELKERHNYSDDLIHFALNQLKENDLVDDYQSDHFAGLSRREIIRRIGLGSMIALPLISGLIAPAATNAASNDFCTPNSRGCRAPGTTRSSTVTSQECPAFCRQQPLCCSCMEQVTSRRDRPGCSCTCVN